MPPALEVREAVSVHPSVAVEVVQFTRHLVAASEVEFTRHLAASVGTEGLAVFIRRLPVSTDCLLMAACTHLTSVMHRVFMVYRRTLCIPTR